MSRIQSPPLAKGRVGWGPSIDEKPRMSRIQSPPLGKGRVGWGPSGDEKPRMSRIQSPPLAKGRGPEKGLILVFFLEMGDPTLALPLPRGGDWRQN
jgi:hypothetical protein